MRLVIQRVSSASVQVDDKIVGEIQSGLLVLLGVHKNDTTAQIPWMVNKMLNLRIFEDEAGKMNKSVKDICGNVLIVSQFTLYGNCANGRRPDFLESAPGPVAEPIYNQFVVEASKELPVVQKGIFGAMMKIALVNEGPVTMIIDG